MPKVAAYVILHYGKDYLSYAIRSVYDQVDEIFIFYTETPSHGTGQSIRCPDTERDLRRAAYEYDPQRKIQFIKGRWNQEGEHRMAAYNFIKSQGRFDLCLLLDADEIWEAKGLEECIKDIYDHPHGQLLCWMKHLWRSFEYVCEDPMRQSRLSHLGAPIDTVRYAPCAKPFIWHFGYARKLEDIQYKISIHGHKSEWRDPNWLDNKFKAWPPPADTHPTCVGFWNPVKMDKNELPEIMKSHPYFNLDPIV